MSNVSRMGGLAWAFQTGPGFTGIDFSIKTFSLLEDDQKQLTHQKDRLIRSCPWGNHESTNVMFRLPSTNVLEGIMSPQIKSLCHYIWKSMIFPNLMALPLRHCKDKTSIPHLFTAIMELLTVGSVGATIDVPTKAKWNGCILIELTIRVKHNIVSN